MEQIQLANRMLDQSKDLIWIVNKDFQLVYANKMYFKFMKEVTGEERKLNESAFVEAFGEADVELWKAYYNRALNGESFDVEEHYSSPELSDINYSQISFEPIHNDDQEIIAVSCRSKDSAEIVKDSFAVNSLMDASLDVFCSIDEAGNFVYVSAASSVQWGYSPKELIGKPHISFVLEEDVAKTLEMTSEVINNRQAKNFVNRYKRKDGGIAYNLWSATWVNTSKLIICVARDGNETIKEEEKTYRSEQRFKALVQDGSDLIAILSADGRYMYVSPSSTPVLGIAPEEFIDESPFDYIHPDDREKTLTAFEEIETKNKVVLEPYRFRNKKMEWRWIETVLTNMLDNPSVNGIVCNSRDITSRIEQDERIELSQKRFESLVENSMDCVIIISPEGKTTYVSGSVKKILGYSCSEAMAIDFEELVHPDDLPEAQKALMRCIEHPGIPMKGYTSRVKHKNGSWRWIEPVITNLLHDPSVEGIVDNFRDITEQVEEQHKLKLLESVVTHTTDAILITEAEPLDDPGPKIIYVNEAFTKMTGYEAHEVIGKSPRILQGPNSNREELAELGRALRDWKPYEITLINYKKSGEEFWINFSVTPVANEKGHYTHWIAIERDVTEQKNKELENELINSISGIFNQSSDVSLIDCLSDLCEHIAKFGDFDLAEVWLPAIDAKSINRVANYAKGEAGTVFCKETKQISSCAPEEGLPGEVWKSKETQVWRNAEGKWHTKRKKAAKKAGIEAMMGVPLKHNDEVIGVLVAGTGKAKSTLDRHVELLKRLKLVIGSELSRKKVEIELAQIFNFTPDLICVAGFDGYIKRINPAGLEILGYSIDEIRSRPITSFIHEQDRSLTSDNQVRLYGGENLRNFENRYITKEGKIVWLSWTATSSPEHGVVYAVAKNITEAKKLRELNRQVNILAKIGSWEINMLNLNFEFFWSSEVHQLHETDPKTFVPNVENALNFYREDFRQLVYQNFEKCFISGEPFDFEAVLVTTKRKEIWVRVIGDAELIDGRCTRVYGSFQDIGSRKEVEIRLQSLTDNLPGVVFQYLVNPDGTDGLQYVSKSSSEVWGFSPEEIIQNNQLVWEQIAVGGELEKVQASIERSIDLKTEWTATWKYVMPNGEIRTHSGFGSPTFQVDGTVLFNSVVLDITEQAKNEELLKRVTKLAKIGSWEYNLLQNKIYWSEMVHSIMETDPKNVIPTKEMNISFFRADFRSVLQEKLNNCEEKGIPFDLEAVIETKAKTEKWVRILGRADILEGKPYRIYGSIQDINERKKSEISLAESENRVRTIFEAEPECIKLLNQECELLMMNPAGIEMIEAEGEEEVIGKSVLGIILPEHRPAFMELTKKVFNGDVGKLVFEIQGLKGTRRWLETHAVPMKNDQGETISLLGVTRDITEQKKAQESILNSEEKRRLIMNGALDAIICIDDDQLISFWNPQAEVVFGWKEAEAMGQKLSELIVPEAFRKYHNEGVIHYRETGEERIFNKLLELTAIRRSGEEFPIELTVIPVKQGDEVFFCAFIRDITQRKTTEEHILKANERFEKVTEATNDAIWDWDLKNKTFYRSKAIERFFGKDASKSLDEEDFWKDNFCPEDVEMIQLSVAEAIADPKRSRWELEYRIFNDKGETCFVIDRGIIIRNERGEAIRMVGAMTDITQQKQMELELKTLNQELEEHSFQLEQSNKELEQFAFVASHDLQEPLRMISSFMDLLKRKYEDKLDEKALKYIHFATDGASRMKEIILDLLDYSRVGRIKDEHVPIDLNQVLEDYIVLRRRIIKEKNVCIISDNLPVVNSYKSPLIQTIHCILDNAIKYSKENEQPKIEINVTENQQEWTVAIKDNGIGIEEQFFDKIFVIFQRLHNKDQYDGTGIGLSIAKKNVELCDGKIWVKSTVNEGSIFYFTINKNQL